MWHRFQPALRDAVLHALHQAGRDGRALAEAKDLRAAVVAPPANSAQPDTVPATELSPCAMAALETAYEEAANAGVKQITTDDVLVGLGDARARGNGHASAAAAAAVPEDEELRRYKIYEELSAIHPG